MSQSEETIELKAQIEFLYNQLEKERQNRFKIVELQLELNRAKSLIEADLLRDTLDGFWKKVLVPNYVSETACNSDNIREGYTKFLRDKNNNIAISLNKQLVNNNITQDLFTNKIMDAYSIISRIIHVCTTSFKSLLSLDDYLLFITDMPQFDDVHKKCVQLIVASVP